MNKYFIYIAAIAFVIMLSGCIESNDKFSISGDSQGEVGIWQKFTITDQSEQDGNVSFKIYWDDGTCCNTKSLPTNAVIPIKHSWFFPGNYSIKVTGTYSDNTSYDVYKHISIKE